MFFWKKSVTLFSAAMMVSVFVPHKNARCCVHEGQTKDQSPQGQVAFVAVHNKN